MKERELPAKFLLLSSARDLVEGEEESIPLYVPTHFEARMYFNCLILVKYGSRTRKRNRHNEGTVLYVGSPNKYGTRVGCKVLHVIRMWDKVAHGIQCFTGYGVNCGQVPRLFNVIPQVPAVLKPEAVRYTPKEVDELSCKLRSEQKNVPTLCECLAQDAKSGISCGLFLGSFLYEKGIPHVHIIKKFCGVCDRQAV